MLLAQKRNLGTRHGVADNDRLREMKRLDDALHILGELGDRVASFGLAGQAVPSPGDSVNMAGVCELGSEVLINMGRVAGTREQYQGPPVASRIDDVDVHAVAPVNEGRRRFRGTDNLGQEKDQNSAVHSGQVYRFSEPVKAEDVQRSARLRGFVAGTGERSNLGEELG